MTLFTVTPLSGQLEGYASLFLHACHTSAKPHPLPMCFNACIAPPYAAYPLHLSDPTRCATMTEDYDIA